MVHHTSNRSGCLKLASAPQRRCAPTAVHFVPDCPVVVLELPVRMPKREVLLCCTLLLSAGSQIVAAFQRALSLVYTTGQFAVLGSCRIQALRFPPFSKKPAGLQGDKLPAFKLLYCLQLYIHNGNKQALCHSTICTENPRAWVRWGSGSS